MSVLNRLVGFAPVDTSNIIKTFKKSVFSTIPLWTLAILVMFFSLGAPDYFLRVVTFQNILVQISIIAIMASGITFVLLTGQIDLSVAEVSGFAGVTAAFAMATLGLSQPLAILLAMVAAVAIGCVNGFGTARLKIPSFMITLAMMIVAGGLSLFLTRGRIIFELPPIVETLGRGWIGPIPNIAIVASVVLGASHFVLKYTRFGRYVYMTGANREAAELSGVNTKFIITACLIISGFTAGLAGLMTIGRLGSAQPDVSPDLLLLTIAAVVLGGTSLSGGEGGISKTVVGLLLIGVLRNGLLQISPDVFLMDAITGAILVGALFMNVLASRVRQAAYVE